MSAGLRKEKKGTESCLKLPDGDILSRLRCEVSICEFLPGAKGAGAGLTYCGFRITIIATYSAGEQSEEKSLHQSWPGVDRILKKYLTLNHLNHQNLAQLLQMQICAQRGKKKNHSRSTESTSIKAGWKSFYSEKAQEHALYRFILIFLNWVLLMSLNDNIINISSCMDQTQL